MKYKLLRMSLLSVAALLFGTLAWAAISSRAGEATTIYSWQAGSDAYAETGGTAAASGGGDSDKDITKNYIRLKGSSDFAANVITITLDKELHSGDKINVTAYRNKNVEGKTSGFKAKFEKGEDVVASSTGLEFVNINEAVKETSEYGTAANTCTFDVPESAAGSKTITITRSHTATNLFVTKLEITSTASGSDGGGSGSTEFKDFAVDLRDANGGILTSEEASASQTITFGLSVGEGGAVSRVAADAANTNAVITGKTGNNHGLQNFSATVPVSGSVQITMSTCSWGGDVTVKNAAGETVASFTTKKGEGGSGCYTGKGKEDENIVSAKYVGDATTLTISGGAYVGYFAVEAVNASSTTVSYSLGSVECQGTIVPTGGTYAVGDAYTIPAKNFTLYKEGYTLTGWTDGTNTYNNGQEISLTGDLALTPVFTANEVTLADRTEPVTVKWNFRRDEGAPTVGWEGQTGLVWVAQATIGEKTIDVALPFSTSPGKFNNKNNTDWIQINNGTKFTVPSCKGATISMEAYNNITTTTIDGQTDYTQGKTISYEVANTADAVDVVIGDGSYYRYIQVVLPVVASGPKTYNNEALTIEFPFDNTSDISKYTTTVDGVISVAASDFTPTDATIGTGSRSKDPDNGLSFITFTGNKPVLHWNTKPVKGLTFTPTQIKMYVQRFGTNIKDGVTITAKTDNGETVTLGTWTARRANWDDSQEEAQWGEKLSNLVNEIVIDLTEAQQTALASTEGLHIYATTNASNRAAGFADIRISGLINGTAADVNKYTLAVAANPAEGGTVSKYPNADEYEENTEVTLTATENFGYDFVNWKNAAGEEVSTEAKFKYTVNANETLTANFKKVNTYELALTVDGTNDYMVTVSPEPTVVDGKNMYEEGAKVVLTANQYEGLVTFTNWSDNSTNSELNVTMDENKQITAYYSEADIIAGWDFYKAGANGRKADFAAADNDADALNLVETATGNTSGWLDKSTLAGGGYESFKGAAVNWRTGEKEGDVGNWHWQTKVNAEAFTDVNVQFQMLYNYNAYQTYDAEYSLDGENWTKFGSVTMEGAKAVASFDQKLPEAANNQKDLYIRMIADKTSEVKGSSSKNDGNTLAMFFITGTPKLVDDPVPPTLVSSVPENNATGASASGKIVLNFDKKVQVAEDTKGTLVITGGVGGQQLTPAVSGKVITLEYKDLDYAKSYTFTLPANSVKNLTGAALADAITIKFTTMERPTVTKAPYDAMVATVEELLDAINTANTRADQNTRFRIFIKKGTYNIPLKEDVLVTKAENYQVPECITFITGNNISFIGEDRDETIITNAIPADATFAGTYGTTSKYDGIGNSDVFQIASSVSGLYWQDLTVETGMEDGTGRDLAIQDKGTKNIYKNVALRGYQDTWTSNNNNGLYYFEGGYLRGRTDYMCGKGDIYFNEVELRQIQGGYAAVPSTPAKIGWVFKGCTINGEASPAVKDKDGNVIPAENVDGNYTLGRPWGKGTPTAYFIDTKMNVIPSAIGWSEMSGGFPKQFAEYNSTTKTGATIDLSGRKKTFDAYDKKEEVIDPVTGEKTVVYTNRRDEPNNPELTAAEAAEYSDMSKMFGDWNPQLQTEAAPVVSDVKLEGNTLSWTGNNYSLLYVICKDGDAIAFTDDTTFDLSTLPASAAGSRAATASVYSVRAANEMGGLSKAVVASDATGIQKVGTTEEAVKTEYFNLQGQRVTMLHRGVIIEVKTMADGSKQVTKRIVK